MLTHRALYDACCILFLGQFSFRSFSPFDPSSTNLLLSASGRLAINWILNPHYTFLVEPSVVQPEQRPCDAHPCGTNAECRQQGQAVTCICPADYIGDPYSACRPECVLNDDCPREQSCVRGKCVNPCPGTCGINAECRVTNHVPVCTCLTGHTGDPYGTCRPIPVIRKIII
jgi:hypothetical protein